MWFIPPLVNKIALNSSIKMWKIYFSKIVMLNPIMMLQSKIVKFQSQILMLHSKIVKFQS